MQISEVAKHAGVGVETVRFYERKALIRRPPKPQHGYRSYSPETVERIRFIREAQDFGFTLRETSELLSICAEPTADCAQVRHHAEGKLADVRNRINRLADIADALKTLIASCPGQGSTQVCSILDALNGRSHKRNDRQSETSRTSRARKCKGMDDNMKTLAFKIDGMHCSGCTDTLTALLATETGVATAVVGFDSKTARVLYDPSLTDADRLIAAIGRAGFNATVAKPRAGT